MERIKGCTHNTLVKITNEYMGSQWALFMPTHSIDFDQPGTKGPHQQGQQVAAC